MEVLTDTKVVVILQHINASNQHVYTSTQTYTMLCVNCISILKKTTQKQKDQLSFNGSTLDSFGQHDFNLSLSR